MWPELSPGTRGLSTLSAAIPSGVSAMLAVYLYFRLAGAGGPEFLDGDGAQFSLGHVVRGQEIVGSGPGASRRYRRRRSSRI